MLLSSDHAVRCLGYLGTNQVLTSVYKDLCLAHASFHYEANFQKLADKFSANAGKDGGGASSPSGIGEEDCGAT